MTLIGTVPAGLAASAARIGNASTVLTDEQVSAFIAEQLGAYPFDGRSVCVLVPDGTRTCPLPLLMRAVHGALHGRASRLTVLIALGTHPPMSEEALSRHLGYPSGRLAETYPGTTVVNHEWWKAETFAHLGTVPASRVTELSEGRLTAEVPVLLNRAVVEHDIALVVGPVLPHEVVGMSGGNKYFFPGVGGKRIIDVSHWLGALITSAEIIGTTGLTPVRALIDDGAALIPAEKLALSVVTADTADRIEDSAVDDAVPASPGGPVAVPPGGAVPTPSHGSVSASSGGPVPVPPGGSVPTLSGGVVPTLSRGASPVPLDGGSPVPSGGMVPGPSHGALHSVSFGDTRASWASAAEVCAATHVTYLAAPVRRVLSVVPPMYDEIWTAAKGFYKVEPVVADGGEVILFAPHVTELSSTHPEIHDIGYHCRDYFVAQWDRFAAIPWGVLAHSTHLRGAGTYDPRTGEERLRVRVTLATAIPESVCRAANLGYRDPSTIDPAAYARDPETLVVPRAGETLFRLDPSA
ncbi:lactate racemase domain-containing protein [Actinoplanes sp. N902-109]|uniref:lactate racemase domain-containing protein n=1 Tax=Actinoplanes sp. (strain N902-109) TaxID=649831 RepID=UPI0003294BDC|nr:lactate racemase domain-containing protein [Actinoplanes sp. N902-109]AGL19860.1 hypothetical protein L083_6350 [Actinoplanes sp. N902-109]